MKRLILATLLGLTACGPTEVQVHEAFLKDCIPQFDQGKCEILYKVYHASNEARDAANIAQIAAGVSAGLAAGASAGRSR